MSGCCPGYRCKNTGSGYVKDAAPSVQAQELNKQMNDLIAARAAQETAIWAPIPVAVPTPYAAAVKNPKSTPGNHQK